MRTATELKRVLVVDGNPLLREAIRRRLFRHQSMKWCGGVGDVSDAHRVVRELEPALVVLDLDVNRGQGMNLIRGLCGSGGPKVLVYSKYSELLYAERALNAGASGFIQKSCEADELFDAMTLVLSGKMYLSSSLAERILSRVVGHPSVRPGESPVESLSNREREVFRLLGDGRTTRQIGEILGLSLHTIQTHRENIKQKLGCKTAAELVRRAVQWMVEEGPTAVSKLEHQAPEKQDFRKERVGGSGDKAGYP